MEVKQTQIRGLPTTQPKYQIVPFANGGAIGASVGKMLYAVVTQRRIYKDYCLFLNIGKYSITLVALRFYANME